MFNRTPVDVIKGLRKGKVERSSFLTTVFSEIKNEIVSSDFAVKTNAIQKLFVLALEGYDMEWARFNILEVMSSNRFSQKRAGYLAAAQCFQANPDASFLATNLFRREFVASNYLDTCIALNCLANIINADLSRELITDIKGLLSSSKPVIRKKVCTISYKFFYFYTEALGVAFDRVVERLKDDNIGVVIGAVNTIYEIARRNPKYVLTSAIPLYELLNSTTNNWLLIKLIKCFSELAKAEPRLKRKLMEPVAKFLNGTPAKSVEFEVIRFIIHTFPENQQMVNAALNRLQVFLDSADANCKVYIVKYLGLCALQEMIEASVTIGDEYRPFMLEALQSKDISIRLRALVLLQLTVICTQTRNETLIEVVTKLLQECQNSDNADIKEEIIGCILSLLSQNHYSLVEDFRWMFEMLGAIAKVKTLEFESQLSGIMLDVLLRVEELRPEACEVCLNLIENFEAMKTDKCETLASILCILGEYGHLLEPEIHHRIIRALLDEKWFRLGFSDTIYNALTSAVFKLMIKLEPNSELFSSCFSFINEKSARIGYMEAQERCKLYNNILQVSDKSLISNLSYSLPELQPVQMLAQSLLQPPADLTVSITIQESELISRKEDGKIEYFYFRDEDLSSDSFKSDNKLPLKKSPADSSDPFIIKSTKPKKKKGKKKKGKTAVEEVKETTEASTEVKNEVPQPRQNAKYKVNRDPALVPGGDKV